MSPDTDAAARGRGRRQPRRGENAVLRVVHAWGALSPEQRLAAMAALALWVTMLLPWYSKSTTIIYRGAAKVTETSQSAYGAFSFVEAAVLLVSAGVLAMLFARAERRAFHLPGGDGFIVMIGGGWAALLIFYRMLDKPGTTGNDRITATVGIQWGIFIALAAAGWLAYAGMRIRQAHRPEPDPEDDPTYPGVERAIRAQRTSAPPERGARTERADRPAPDRFPPRPGTATRPTRAVSREDAEQLSFDVPEPDSEPDPFRERRR